jgi:hypothetical protein
MNRHALRVLLAVASAAVMTVGVAVVSATPGNAAARSCTRSATVTVSAKLSATSRLNVGDGHTVGATKSATAKATRKSTRPAKTCTAALKAAKAAATTSAKTAAVKAAKSAATKSAQTDVRRKASLAKIMIDAYTIGYAEGEESGVTTGLEQCLDRTTYSDECGGAYVAGYMDAMYGFMSDPYQVLAAVK